LGESNQISVSLIHRDYREIDEALSDAGEKEADGILLDMGLNNAQIEDPERGISFLREGPLDMRMNRDEGFTAADWLNKASVREIEVALKELGGENWAKRIAEVIVDRRKAKPLATTTDLVDCVLAAIPVRMRDKRIHPATRTFQAVRCVVTGELDELDEAVEKAARCLAPGGTLVVLAYHSGEDGAVKRVFRRLAQAEDFSEHQRKPLRPTEAEVQSNPKSRSARLRALHRNREVAA
ncbi:MAG: 16S rRNA (cytosine(1402)-N(4))-methyltransferase RsmH, partial [Fimbriimonadaceae bacterium]|nr:16S rRNA (cytosine(1402)-N(4))-methyltransferase RsmH [Fimbriimonadaceae bacterium]